MLLAALIGLVTGLVAIAFHMGLDFASSFILVSDCVTNVPLVRESTDLHSAMRFLR